ncbi:MAG: hypothetical protein JXB23_15170 [Candidatus Aminicenantes bacterium]|nr:hypothetical protein [Candidatus Aminicenantes bacterium]
MNKRIGIRKEDKNPWERRSPLIPAHVRELIANHAIDVYVQTSPNRIFSDNDFALEGAEIVGSLQACPIVFAVKEIPIDLFERHKVYIFFSHTIKGQPANRDMLKKMVELECTLIDYERIIDDQGRRLVFFGRQAGQAGMIDTLWALGQRLDFFGIDNPISALEQAFRYPSLVGAKEEIAKAGWGIKKKGLNSQLSPLVFGFAGYGHVSLGAQEIFSLLPVEEIQPEKLRQFFAAGNFSSNRVYKVVFKEEHMVRPVLDVQKFDLQEYYDHPDRYQPVFETYLPYLSVLVNCIYWTPQYPRLVTKKYLKKLWSGKELPSLKVIGDISCDVDGAIECTVKATTPGQPVFVYDPLADSVVDGSEGRGVVIMAVDNLPAEIPLESSLFFSQVLKPLVPAIAGADFNGKFDECRLPAEVKRAVILFRGKFTREYEYMRNFIN